MRGAISGAIKKKLGLDVTSEKTEERGRVYRLCGAPHNWYWTKPLCGSAAWQGARATVPPHLPAFLRKSDCDTMEGLLAALSMSQRSFP